MSAEIVRILVTDPQLAKSREDLIKLLSSHVNKDLTMIEAVLMKDLLDIGICTVKHVYVQKSDENE
jgi:hypothetical protein